MDFRASPMRLPSKGFSIVEVMIAAALVGLGLGSISAMAAKTIRILRSTRQTTASSHVLQQRIETIRGKAWSEISNAPALARVMQAPTASQQEIADRDVIECVTVRVPDSSAVNFASGPRSFSVKRMHNAASIDQSGDFGDEPTLLFESFITWRDTDGEHQRKLRTIVCRAGLTRSGVFGSALGRPRSGPPSH